MSLGAIYLAIPESHRLERRRHRTEAYRRVAGRTRPQIPRPLRKTPILTERGEGAAWVSYVFIYFQGRVSTTIKANLPTPGPAGPTCHVSGRKAQNPERRLKAGKGPAKPGYGGSCITGGYSL